MQVRELLYNLSTSASACQHLPAPLYAIIDAVLEGGVLDLSAGAVYTFLEHAPALFKFLRSYGLSLPEKVLQLLQQLRAASAAAWPAGALVPQSRRTPGQGVAGG